MSVPLFISIADVAELPNAGIKAVPARIQVTANESPVPRIVCKPSENVCTGRRIQLVLFRRRRVHVEQIDRRRSIIFHRHPLMLARAVIVPLLMCERTHQGRPLINVHRYQTNDGSVMALVMDLVMDLETWACTTAEQRHPSVQGKTNPNLSAR